MSTLVGMMVLAPAPPAGADTITVTTTVDGGPGSLRDAIDQANTTPGDDTIVLPGGHFVLDKCGSLDNANVDGDLQHRQSTVLTIEGHGASLTQTCFNERAIESESAAGTLRLEDVEIHGGSAPRAAGVLAAGRLEMVDSLVSETGMFLPLPDAGYSSAGVVEADDLLLDRTAVVRNTTASETVLVNKTATIRSSTIAANTGNGLVTYGYDGSVHLSLEHATLVDNGTRITGTTPSDLLVWGDVVIEVAGSVVERCGQSQIWEWHFPADVISHGWNATSDPHCPFDSERDLRVDDLGLPASPSPAGLLLPAYDSPLIDAIWDCVEGPGLDVDQRGEPRPQGPGCDIGAAEVFGPAPIDVTTATDGVPGSLRAAIDEANNTLGDDIVRLDPSLGEYVLDVCGAPEDANASGDLDPLYVVSGPHDLTILGEGATVRQTCAGEDVLDSHIASIDLRAVTLVDGGVRGESVTVFGSTISNAPNEAVWASTDVEVAGSIIEGSARGVVVEGGGCFGSRAYVRGSEVRNNGLGIEAPEVLLIDSTVSGNHNPGPTGAGVVALDQAIIQNSTIVGNNAAGSGGGLHLGWCRSSSFARLINATIVGNSAPSGANVDVAPGVEIKSYRSVVATPTGGGSDCSRLLTAAVASFDSDDSCGFHDPDSPPSGDPLLGPLADNGGLTHTLLPLAGSPLIDGAWGCTGTSLDPDDLIVSRDQRGVQRAQGAWCDIGAVEVERARTFSDVSEAQPFFHEIECLAGLGIAEGWPSGGFGAHLEIRRHAIAAWLWRLAGSPTPAAPPAFSDIAPDHPFADAIAWLDEQGLANGYPDGTFRSRNRITREALAAWLWRYAGEPTPGGPSPFTDVEASDEFGPAITWLAEAQITGGYPDGSFKPTNRITREAAAAWFCRYEHHVDL